MTKRGAIPAHVAPIHDRLQVSGESWLKLAGEFGRLCRRAAGRPESLRRDALRRRSKRTEGNVNSRALFA